ncbi:SDR family NAD(P)-dependent oxidoreductase [Streptomyces sp. NPDC050619]|uniref:SDR family NAD(P)-dependent oxidoreductase n=1 Tax=Streptomyces sp. NPDC050619 TaxID=3157214 RepID=UPI003419BC63
MSKGTALIVGVGPGLGLALAEAFARDGHPVALFGRDAERLGKHAAELTGQGFGAGAYQADAGNPQDLRTALGRAVDDLGAPEVLVYNAAVLQTDSPTGPDADAWAQTLAVNVTGAVVAAQTVLPLLREGRGSLLFTGGGLALQPSLEYTTLSVGKAALRAYVQVLHDDQRDSGVHVSTVTVAGAIGGEDPRFAPDVLAAAYLDLHHQPKDQWQAELVYA